MSAPRLSRAIALSPQFFTTVFCDAFLFGRDASDQLKDAHLTDAEKRLALAIHKSNLYGSRTWEECAALCNRLSGVYHWQDNSEGPVIFASKVLYLLRFKGKDAAWFAAQVRLARDGLARPRKKLRATVITHTAQGIVLTEDHKRQLLLPGGHVEAGELPMAAAARELYEETGLEAQSLEFLFEQESEFYLHQVFVVTRYRGEPVARSDAMALQFLPGADGPFPERLSRSHVCILERYQQQPRRAEGGACQGSSGLV